MTVLQSLSTPRFDLCSVKQQIDSAICFVVVSGSSRFLKNSTEQQRAHHIF